MEYEYNQYNQIGEAHGYEADRGGGRQTDEYDRRHQQQRRSGQSGQSGVGTFEVYKRESGRGGSHKNRKGLLGLSNLGNTCFMNSALQCLTHTHGLQKYFRFCSHAYASKAQSHRQKLLMSFAHWFERDWGKNVSANYHSPEDILRAVQQLSPIFQGYAQQDSQEFLRCVLDNMHEELRREVPDDLSAYFLETFGFDPAPRVNGEAASSSSSSGAVATSSSRSVGSDSAAGTSRSRPASAASSARQFMQLCQTTEGVTDQGEIRLSATKQSTPGTGQSGGSASSTAAPQAPPVNAWSGEDCRSPASSSSSTAATSQHARCPSGGGGGGAPASTAETSEGASESGGAAAGESQGERAKAMHFSSIISELFQGNVVSTVRCLECQTISRTKEPIYDVSVQIPNPNELWPELGNGGPPPPELAHQVGGVVGRGPSWTGMFGNVTGKVKSWFYDKGVEISDCLRKFCAPEYLVGKDKYECEHCKRKTDGERRFAFKDLPEVLCIHIKRFRYDASWFNAQKNSRVVTFPVGKPLDMTPFLDEPPPHPAEYRLIGLIQHIGSMGGGHYISYCQHKRRPQEWYEFDDIQVSTVSPEQVERAEPYILFYQRVPTKGVKLDRETFKKDRRKMDQSIRNYLSTKANGSANPAEVSEMWTQGPAMRSLLRSPPSELGIVFVSKHWYVRLTTMSHPGPLDNYEYLCPHQLLGCYSQEMATEPFIPISQDLYQSLVRKYGGGPLISSLEICPKCQRHLKAFNDRKQAEYDLVSKYDTKDTGEGKGWYLVDALWVSQWKRYVKTDHITDIKDLCPPGPVSNERLFDKKTGELRSNLKIQVDYIGVNCRVWWLFQHVHGGGPAICRDDLNVYAKGHRLEIEMMLEELVSTSGDFGKRVSWQYVDECKGDDDLFAKRYPEGVPPLRFDSGATDAPGADDSHRPGSAPPAADKVAAIREAVEFAEAPREDQRKPHAREASPQGRKEEKDDVQAEGA